MKKTTIAIMMLAALMSCKKERTCECIVTQSTVGYVQGGVITTNTYNAACNCILTTTSIATSTKINTVSTNVSVIYEDESKRQMKNLCNNKTEVAPSYSLDYRCKIK